MRRTFYGLALLLGILPASLCFAYSVQPMIYTLTPSGSGSTVRLTVQNSREGLLNVEVEPYAVTADDAGVRTFTPATDDFVIFPPQASIAGDKAQLFQIRYIGPATLPKGRVYVLRVHQTNTVEAVRPETGATAQTHLALSLNFNTTAIVQAKQLKPDVTVEGQPAPDARGVLHARVANRGDGVADLTRIGWALDHDGKVDHIDISDIKYGDAIFLEPGHSRDIILSQTIKAPARLVLDQTADDRGKSRD